MYFDAQLYIENMSKRDTIILSYLNLQIKVCCDRKDHLAWLREFLCPQFSVADGNASNCSIALIEDNGWFNNLHRKPPQWRNEINGFILDKTTVKLLVWHTGKHQRILFDEELHVFYLISHQGDQVVILVPSTGGKAVRMALMRVIREYAMNYEFSGGNCFVHSSAFDYHGKAVMIAGPKNSAKTSLLIYFLTGLSSHFISNDRVLLCFDNATPVVLGMPTVVTIPQTTHRMFSRVGINLPIYKYHHWYTIAESANQYCFAQGDKNGDYTISPSQFCELIGTKASGKTELSAIIFSQVSETCSGITLKEIDTQKAIKSLNETRFARDVIHGKSVFRLASKKPLLDNEKHNYQEFIGKCASEIPCFDCIVGYNAYKKRNAAHLIKQIESARTVRR